MTTITNNRTVVLNPVRFEHVPKMSCAFYHIDTVAFDSELEEFIQVERVVCCSTKGSTNDDLETIAFEASLLNHVEREKLCHSVGHLEETEAVTSVRAMRDTTHDVGRMSSGKVREYFRKVGNWNCNGIKV